MQTQKPKARGIFDHKDVLHQFELGAEGVQAATRFVTTEECDADIAYKEAYINAKEEDIVIVKSPVGMPGRAIKKYVFIIPALGGKSMRAALCFFQGEP